MVMMMLLIDGESKVEEERVTNGRRTSGYIKIKILNGNVFGVVVVIGLSLSLSSFGRQVSVVVIELG